MSLKAFGDRGGIAGLFNTEFNCGRKTEKEKNEISSIKSVQFLQTCFPRCENSTSL